MFVEVGTLRRPLWPAGHLLHKWGDWLSRRLSPIADIAEEGAAAELLISPQVGEMSGRTEGGAVPPTAPAEAIERPP
ncbi:hypothetical protein EJ068_15140 [Mesorhizobium sp. M2A.F.Ca.ET.043.02.1.1]|nr:hypothetical protein EJ068_15140 [Mesorhizobium sp. M2A.F.Ca.ET.043.02.1.1]